MEWGNVLVYLSGYLVLVPAILISVFARGWSGWLLAVPVALVLPALPSMTFGPTFGLVAGWPLVPVLFTLRCWAQYTRLGRRATGWVYRIMNSIPRGESVFDPPKLPEPPRMPLDRRDGRWFRRPPERE